MNGEMFKKIKIQLGERPKSVSLTIERREVPVSLLCPVDSCLQKMLTVLIVPKHCQVRTL